MSSRRGTTRSAAPSVVVAVLDTGVRFDHADLMRVAAGGNLLPGYDMISDAVVANDGDGRDADASDPGDWLTLAEVSDSGRLSRTAHVTQNSSWHGTQTSGLIAALTGNGVGMASVGRNVRVLPVRVLGKCGGFDSDIIAGMRWAAGLSVAGVPTNPNPARVLNMSLGGDGACTAAYVSARGRSHRDGRRRGRCGRQQRRTLRSARRRIVPGVIAVAGLRHAGTEGGLLRSRSGNRAERAGRQLRGCRGERCVPVSDPHHDQPRATTPVPHARGVARPTPTPSMRRSARAFRRRWWREPWP